jgi:hypothetical protein
MKITRLRVLVGVLTVSLLGLATQFFFNRDKYADFFGISARHAMSVSGAAARAAPNSEYWDTYSLIEDGLYQGGHVPEPPPGTTAVLNLCEQADPYKCELHSWEAIPDAAPAPSLEWLRARVQFVDEQRKAGKTVYVHCFGGVSRAGMVITAYLMQKNGWARDEALAFVRKGRPITNPNPAFMKLLEEWEHDLRKSKPANKEE